VPVPMRSALFAPYVKSAWTGPSSSSSSPGRDARRVHPALQRAPATSGPRPRGAGAGAHHRSVAPRQHRSPQRARRTHPRVPPVGRVVRAPARGGSWTQGEGRGHAPMTTASASGAPRITSTGSPRSEPRSEVLGNSPDQTPASHAEYLQRDRGFGALHLGEVATPPFVQGGAEAVPRDSQCPAHHCEPPVGHCIPPPCAGTTDSSCPIVHP
jgi:hypothetical protein